MFWGSTILIGLVIASFARVLAPGGGRGAFFLSAVLGLAGSVGATYFVQALGFNALGQATAPIASAIGAIALLTVDCVMVGNAEGEIA
jgi:uncharacterized membrane protein YeaQ/YmgE (transglycosylase-associated protein family)